MYEIVHTKAIIILERHDKEHDKVFFVFSEILGLTSVSTPGILKPEAKLRSLIQPLRIVTSDIIVGKSTKKMTTVIESFSFESLLMDENTKQSLLKVFEFIVSMLPRNTSAPEIYHIFESFIYSLTKAKTVSDIKALEIETLHQLLLILGYEDGFDVETHTSNSLYYGKSHKKLLHRVNAILKEIQM